MEHKKLKIGELAQEVSTPEKRILPSTIRFWTTKGLLSFDETTQGGLFLYSPTMVDRAKKIIKLQEDKRLSLEEIKQELDKEA